MALDFKWDNRLIERKLEKGLITKEEYQEYLKNLPDVADKSEVLDIELPGSGEDDDDNDEE